MRAGKLIISLLLSRNGLHERAKGRGIEQGVLIHCTGTAQFTVSERETVTLVQIRIAGHVNGREHVDLDLVQIYHGPSANIGIAPLDKRRLGDGLTVYKTKRFRWSDWNWSIGNDGGLG